MSAEPLDRMDATALAARRPRITTAPSPASCDLVAQVEAHLHAAVTGARQLQASGDLDAARLSRAVGKLLSARRAWEQELGSLATLTRSGADSTPAAG